MKRNWVWIASLMILATGLVVMAAAQENIARPAFAGPAMQSDDATPTPEPEPEPEAAESDLVPDETAPAGAEAADMTEKYGLVAGSIEDRGFNQLAWEGLQRAADELGVEVDYLEAEEAPAIEESVNQFLKENYSGIVTVGVEMAPATKAAARANPNVPFISIDFPSQSPNDLGLLFSTDEPAFMAGYLAAGMSETGIVCTFGGRQTPPVLIFLVGFEAGVDYYNAQNGTDVQLLGWQTDLEHQAGGEGRFVGDFASQDQARMIAEELFDQECDIIFPVAGGAGLGAAEVARDRGLLVIGVDADQAETNPDYADVYLTSVIKHVDNAVYEAIKSLHETGFRPTPGTFTNYIGTLENGGVGLAPYHSLEDEVPQALQAELETIHQQLLEGSLSTAWPLNPPDSRLNLEQLRNATYPAEETESGMATLTDGVYEAPAAPGSSSMIEIRLLEELAAYGDLNGDGLKDAAVVLVSSGGGSGTFYNLAAVLDENGRPAPAATAFLGDRVEVQSVSITDGQIVVELLTRGEAEPMAEPPSQPMTRTFSLQYSLVE